MWKNYRFYFKIYLSSQLQHLSKHPTMHPKGLWPGLIEDSSECKMHLLMFLPANRGKGAAPTNPCISTEPVCSHGLWGCSWLSSWSLTAQLCPWQNSQMATTSVTLSHLLTHYLSWMINCFVVIRAGFCALLNPNSHLRSIKQRHLLRQKWLSTQTTSTLSLPVLRFLNILGMKAQGKGNPQHKSLIADSLGCEWCWDSRGKGWIETDASSRLWPGFPKYHAPPACSHNLGYFPLFPRAVSNVNNTIINILPW